MSLQDPIPQGGVDVIVSTTVFLFLAIVTTGLRFYSRAISARPFSIEDWLLLAGLVSFRFPIGIEFLLTGSLLSSGPLLQLALVMPVSYRLYPISSRPS
jgi:hypothetical protein